MTVRLRTPFKDLGTVDVRRDSRVRLDKVLASLCYLQITTDCPLPEGFFGIPYGPVTLTEKDGRAPFTWSIAAGSLPSGLTLNPATGVISGTPIP